MTPGSDDCGAGDRNGEGVNSGVSVEDRDPSDGDGPNGVDGSENSWGRRPYLGALGAAAAALAGCMGAESDDEPDDVQTDPEPGGGGALEDESDGENLGTRHGIEFDRVLDAVDDLGLDPSGDEAVNARLDDALSEGTLVRFPEGEYLFDGEFAIGADRVGLLGEGDVRFVPRTGYTRLLFNYHPVPDDVLIENVDIDIRADGTTTGIRLRCRNRFHIQDIEFLGRGTNDSPGGTTSAFLLAIRNEDGRGILRNAVAKKGSRIDGYKGGNGRIGVWVGWSNKGTVRIEGCDFREFGNNGVYGSRTPGKVEIVDCYFLNNNASGPRIGGAGSYVENCTVEIDLDRYTGGAVDSSTEFNTRAIVVEQGVQREGAPPLPGGAEIRGCTLHARSSPLSQSVVEQSPVARSLVVRDTEIRCDIDGTPAVRRGPVGSLPYRPNRQRPPRPHWTRLENVTIDGNAVGGAAVDLRFAPGSTVTDCEISCPGEDRDGVLLDHSPRGEVSGSTIRTDGHPIVVDVDPTTSDTLLCIDSETVLERLDDGDPGIELTAAPPLLQTIARNVGADGVCLGLGSTVPTLPVVDSVSDSLRIGIDALEEGIPIGRVLNRS